MNWVLQITLSGGPSLQSLDCACPLLLIGSDYRQLTPIEPVCLGPQPSPAAINTRLGWTIQGQVHQKMYSLITMPADLHPLSIQYMIDHNSPGEGFVRRLKDASM